MKPGPYAKPGTYRKPGQGMRPALQRQPTAEERRRAQRVLVRIPVVAHLQVKDKQVKDKTEPVSGFTHTVSASGGMIILPEGLAAGTKFVLENPSTKQRVEVNVVRPSQLNQEGSLVPVEFLTPAPQFWNIFFPPNPN